RTCVREGSCDRVRPAGLRARSVTRARGQRAVAVCGNSHAALSALRDPARILGLVATIGTRDLTDARRNPMQGIFAAHFDALGTTATVAVTRRECLAEAVASVQRTVAAFDV